jgi:predicted amidohydrolase
MKEFLRIAGAQIPVTADMAVNVQTIKDAIDWASENSVDYLITPEASLSGYKDQFANWKDLVDALRFIEQYSAEKKVGLCLGTMWAEPRDDSIVRLNQIRVYHNGQFGGATNKTFLSPYDYELNIEANDAIFGFMLDASDDTSEAFIQSAGFICKDLYARENTSDNAFTNLPAEFYRAGAQLYVHITNAERGIDPVHDRVHYNWHTANAEMVSWISKRPLITVDNSIMMTGEDYDGQTSSPSGVVICGEWVVQAPRTGKHYFYYDFPVEQFAKLDWTDYMKNRKVQPNEL